ncbi:uncharacterized protein LOC110023638 [Phalaenopsis equestris]|uniref:uncharacterized protein LOC110023638 n=1 Tax=Phalaenopsis equestris TaxID=78828 RepID=UPI0009E4362D|nr:uncharacterized protein LOC110023638 [Phalaenopsis equestris]
MGQGEEVKTRADPKVEIQERGDIFFFYRPKIAKEEAHGVDDVQKMYIILRPESGERTFEEKQSPDSGKEGKKRTEEEKENDDEDAEKDKPEGGHGAQEVNIEKQLLLRFIVMGRKSLPDPSKRSKPYWGFVEMVTTKTEDIKTALKGEEYDTATIGHRRQAPARALAEGVYRILRHQFGRQTHTHLIYKLEFPAEDTPNEPQEEFNIEREGSFIIQIRNPEHSGHGSGFDGLQTKRRAAFPASLQGCLGKRQFAAADPPDFLNYEGCEFLLISASDDIDEELGLDLKTQNEGEEEEADESCSDLIKLFGDSASSKPLFSGTWV